MIYQTFEFIGKGQRLWEEISKQYPEHLVYIDFEERVFKPETNNCSNETEIQLAKEYANKLNQIVKKFGLKIVWKEYLYDAKEY